MSARIVIGGTDVTDAVRQAAAAITLSGEQKTKLRAIFGAARHQQRAEAAAGTGTRARCANPTLTQKAA